MAKKKDLIDVAHPHTIRKFELIEEYIKSWAQKLMLNDRCNSIVFIDCMCNCGVYKDEDGNEVEGTAIRVAKALLDVARTYTNKNIQLYFNDLSQKRIDILKEHLPREERNYQIAISSQDAGELLRTIGPQLYTIEHMHYFLLYDPYEASIDWEALIPFFRNWGEVLINHMVLDSVRAISNAKKKTAKEKYENTYLEEFEKLLPYGSNKEAYEKRVEEIIEMHIQVDDILNDVHLYLPYFNENTVKDVVEALQNAEGGTLPTDIYGEPLSGKKFETLTVKIKKKKQEAQIPGQMTLDLYGMGKTSSNSELRKFNIENNQESSKIKYKYEKKITVKSASDHYSAENIPCIGGNQKIEFPESTKTEEKPIGNRSNIEQRILAQSLGDIEQKENVEEDLFDREEVMKFINKYGLLTYNVRTIRINNYLKSLLEMAYLLTMSNLRKTAIREVQSEIVEMIHNYICKLKVDGLYDELVLQVKQFKLATQIFDAFGETVDNFAVHDLFTTTDTDVDRQFRIAEKKLGNGGIGNVYGNKYIDEEHPNDFKIDVILFVADAECMNQLTNYAEKRFHGMNDDYRRYIANIDSESIRKQYDKIVSNGDVVSEHNFRLPETIQVPYEDGGLEYRTHLFVSEKTGCAKIKLGTWEAGVIAEEEKRNDFVCWIRNPSRASWALCIPYKSKNEFKSAYPDFIIVRRNDSLGYVIDILEPHRSDFKDNLGKAKGFAEYARKNPGVGRIQLIREMKDATGNKRYKRLDMSQSAVRDKVLCATTNDEIDHIFDTDGFFM